MTTPPPLSEPAKLALKTLREEPNANTAQAISDGPFGVDTYTEQDIREGLIELEGRGLAQEWSGGWESTQAGDTFNLS